MRLQSSGVLLLGAAVLQHVDLAAAAVAITFTSLTVDTSSGQQTSLLSIPDHLDPLGGGLSVAFYGNEPIIIREISLWQYSNSEKPDIQLGVSPYRAGFQFPIDFQGPTNPSANTNVTVKISRDTVDQLSNRQKRVPVVLYFQLKYLTPQTSSKTRRQTDVLSTADSRRFALTKLSMNSAEFANLMAAMTSLKGPDSSTADGESGSDGQSTEQPGTSTTTKPTVSASATSTASVTPTRQSASAESSTVISTGAIAGIAVGAGLFVLLLSGALAFFLLRRRRRNAEASHGLGYSGGGMSSDVIAEKEAAHAAVSESGGHSPYTDDSRLHRQRDVALAGPGTRAAGLMASHHQHEQEAVVVDYTPYSDRPSNMFGADPAVVPASTSTIGMTRSEPLAVQSTSSTAPGPLGAVAVEEQQQHQQQRATVLPRSDTAMSGAYAHLVEDGMTAAEIARLEDEERQLDQAIERARGVTTK